MNLIKNILITLLLGQAVMSNPQTMPQGIQSVATGIQNVVGEAGSSFGFGVLARVRNDQQSLRQKVNQVMFKDAASLTPAEQGLRNTVLNMQAVAQSSGADEGMVAGLIDRSINRVSQHASALRVSAPSYQFAQTTPQWYW